MARRHRIGARVRLSERGRLFGRRRWAQIQALGFEGGDDGAPSALVQANAAGERVELPSKVPYRKAKAGDRLIAYGPSGGGYGSPLDRAPQAVLDNVVDGIISARLSPLGPTEQSFLDGMAS